MTRKLSISVPDDVAAVLDEQENASAYIAEAVRLRRKRENIVTLLAEEGLLITPEGLAKMRERYAEHLERRNASRAARAE